jgi:hypothetical protein
MAPREMTGGPEQHGHELHGGGHAAPAKVGSAEVLEEDVVAENICEVGAQRSANADGDCGRVPFGMASNVRDDCPTRPPQPSNPITICFLFFR